MRWTVYRQNAQALGPRCSFNRTSGAFFLWTLRYLLIQDWDMDDDGKPETLRLCFATPKRWLEDGKTIKVEHAPTAFGPLSLIVDSKLSQGEVVANIGLPKRNPPNQILLRIRLPAAWKVTSAKTGRKVLKVDDRSTVDLSSLKGNITIRFTAERN